MGPLKYFLGIEVAQGPKGLFLCQQKHALEIMDECGLLRSNPIDSPIEENHKLALAGGALIADATQYRQLIGRFIYLTITYSQLSYVVHVLSQFMQRPKVERFNVVRRVFWYLKDDPDLGIMLHFDATLQAYAYCDYDWGAYPLTR